MRTLASVTLVLFTVFIAGCGDEQENPVDEQEDAVTDMIDVMEDFADVLADVQDLDSAKAARGRLEDLNARRLAVMPRIEEIRKKSPERWKELEDKYDEKVDALSTAIEEEVKRLRVDPEISAALGPTFEKMADL